MSKLKITWITLAIVFCIGGAFITGVGFDVHKACFVLPGVAMLIIAACFGLGSLEIKE